MVTVYNQILVPTDGNAGVDRAIDHADALAEAHDASLRLLYVVNTASVTQPIDAAWGNVLDLLKKRGQKALTHAESRCGEQPTTTVVRKGTPATTIVDEAESSGCDLIVMGTNGRGGLNRLLLGSVAESVVRSASVPVVTVRTDAESDRPTAATPPEPADAETKTGQPSGRVVEFEPTATDPAVSDADVGSETALEIDTVGRDSEQPLIDAGFDTDSIDNLK
ncbi:MAG: universal stress protein [Natronomonas sp.]